MHASVHACAHLGLKEPITHDCVYICMHAGTYMHTHAWHQACRRMGVHVCACPFACACMCLCLTACVCNMRSCLGKQAYGCEQRLHACERACMRASWFERTDHTRLRVYMHACRHIHAYARVAPSMQAYGRACVCMSVCVCMHVLVFDSMCLQYAFLLGQTSLRMRTEIACMRACMHARILV